MRPYAGTLAVVVALCAGASCGGPSRTQHPEGPLALSLQTVGGPTVDLRALRGRPAVLHLFTTWSLTAQGDLVQLIAADERHRDALVVVGIALDPDGANLVAPWQRANRIAYPIALADEAVRSGRSALGRIVEVPTTVILRSDGRVAHWLPRPLADGELARLLRGVLTGR